MVSVAKLRLAVILFLSILGLNTVSAGDEQLIQAIEAQAARLTVDDFNFDSIYEQTVDLAKKVTHYGPVGSNQIVFTHNGNDTGHEVVVLGQSEDQLEVKKSKRLYIVFRKKDGNHYFVTVALIRDACDLDKDHPKVKVNGIDRLIEWETFDDHLTPARNQVILNALFCVSTFLSPCSFNASVVSPVATKSPHYILKHVPADAEQVKVVTSDGSDADDNFDLYADLFSSAVPTQVAKAKGQGRHFGGGGYGGGGLLGSPVGAVGGIVGGVLGAATGIVCGVLGAIFGGCGSTGGFGVRPPIHTYNTGFAGYAPARPQGMPMGMVVGSVNMGPPMGMGPPPMGPPMGDPMGGMGPPPMGDPYGGQMGPPMGDPMGGMGGPPMGGPPAPPAAGGGYLGGLFGRRKREADEPNRDYSGWKTQYISPTAGTTLKHESEIFYGFGNCPAPPTPVDPKELESASTNEQIIDFYLKILRADCLPDRRAVIMKLLDDGLLIIKGKTMNLNPTSPKPTQHKLNLKDTLELASVAELRAFTIIYNEDVAAPKKDSKSPDGQKDISRSIDFVTEIILRFLKESRLWTRTHMVRLTRYAIILLKSIFAKVQQDQQILEKCAACSQDKEMNANDRLQVVGLLEFIKHGIGPVDKGQDPKEVFTVFYTKNLNALGQLVQYY